MLQWRIYYSNGSTYSPYEGSLFDAPGRGVIAIAIRDEAVGRRILARHDHYWWTGETWLCGDLFGMFDYQCQPGPQKVVHGRTVTEDAYQRVLATALNDPDFPAKTAKAPGETY